MVEIDGDGAVSVAGKTTRWRGFGGLQLEPEVVGDADEADEALEHIPGGRGRPRPGERRWRVDGNSGTRSRGEAREGEGKISGARVWGVDGGVL